MSIATETRYTADDLLAMPENDELTGEEILPGFRCRVGDLFPPRQASEE